MTKRLKTTVLDHSLEYIGISKVLRYLKCSRSYSDALWRGHTYAKSSIQVSLFYCLTAFCSEQAAAVRALEKQFEVDRCHQEFRCSLVGMLCVIRRGSLSLFYID